MKGYVYEVVKPAEDGFLCKSETFNDKSELLLQYTEIGVHFNPSTRKELQGQPKLKGLYGPMFGGINEAGVTVIRYETAEAYKMLSC